MKPIPDSVDLTPTPKILRTLGDIPFDIWQCFAELMDNSIDEFRKKQQADSEIHITWSKPSVPERERTIEISDNGAGMQLSVLQQAAKAGFSTNDPLGNLGLFGMGFNIATARLGEETLFYSATKESPDWIGLRINFEDLIRSGSFQAPVIRKPKSKPEEQGTLVIIRGLKDGVYSDLKTKESSIRSRLESVYSSILDSRISTIYLQGKQLVARRHCTWGATRFIIHKGQKIEAVQTINRDLGNAFFDVSRNRYLSDDEGSEMEILVSRKEPLPTNIIARQRRLRGWIGVQRFADASDFGIDYIRNGRKILSGDRRIFEFENPSTGKREMEYPVEVGGGRIVGELEVDYLIPTYQKNDFNTNDKAWALTRDAIRGEGPLFPRMRDKFGFPNFNDSPLGKLANAYRRNDAGTKHLAAPSSVAKEYTKRFHSMDPLFQTDDKWFKAAQEADRERAGESVTSVTPVATGSEASDSLDSYFDTATPPETTATTCPGAALASTTGKHVKRMVTPPITTSQDELLKNSEQSIILSGEYRYKPVQNGFTVAVWALKSGDIRLDGEKMPCMIFPDGHECDFFYDPSHSLLAEHNISPKQLLLQHLAERFQSRDQIPQFKAYVGLVDNHLQDERINPTYLLERARTLITIITDRLPSLLETRAKDVISTVEQEVADKQKLVESLIETPSLYESYKNRDSNLSAVLAHIPRTALPRIIQQFPAELFDEKLFTYPYVSLDFEDSQFTANLRRHTADRMANCLRDVLLMLDAECQDKSELIRLANTLKILQDRISDE